MDFSTPPQTYYAQHLFIPRDPGAALLRRFAVAGSIAAATCWIAVHAGCAMQKVRR
jgi:hypothetical protein